MTKSLNHIILICFFVSLLAHAQQVPKTVQAYFVEVRSGQNIAIPQNIVAPENAKNTLTALRPYLKDSSAVVRAKAYNIAQLIGVNSKPVSLRQDAVAKLVGGCKDNDSGNVGVVLNYLSEFNLNDFSPAVKDSLATLLNKNISHQPKLIKLVGFLQVKKESAQLTALSQPGNIQSVRWAALLALSRMGDADATANILNRVRKLGTNDDVIYQIFPDLIYTRQPSVFDYIFETLRSDEKNCTSADAEREAPIPCAYRVMEMLALVIKNFPLKADASGDIVTKDYPAALQTAREWFKKNPTYSILKDIY